MAVVLALLVAANGASIEAHGLRGKLSQDPVSSTVSDPQGAAGGAAEGATGAVADTGGKVTGELTSAGTGMVDGKMPSAGEAVGKQVGVDVPNPHAYLGAAIGGASAGLFVSIATFAIATYMVYSWNASMIADGKKPTCGIMSVLCCLCCTPFVCCCPIDAGSED